MQEITSKQRSRLKAIAANLQPVTQIGKGGITDNLLKGLSDALEAHEIIKVTLLPTVGEEAERASRALPSQAASRQLSDICSLRRK